LYDKCETISDKRSSGAQINLLQKLVERATLEPFFYRKRLGSPDYSMIVDLMEEAGEVVAFDIFGRMKSSDLVGYFKWNQHFDTVCRISYSSKIAPSALRMDGFGHPHIATLGSQPGCERYVCSRAYKQAVRRAPNGQPKLRK